MLINDHNGISRRKALKVMGGAAIASALPFRFLSVDNTQQGKNARKRNFFAYRSFWPEFEAMKEFDKAGVNTVCIFAANTNNSLGMPYSKYPPVWRWYGKYDFNSLDKQYDDVLAINPDADFICMIDLNTPIWLQRQLSTECESFSTLSCACSNPAWNKAVTEYLDAIVKHMEDRYGDRINAYLLACGQTDEWMDYSRGIAGRHKTGAWETWLKSNGREEKAIPAFSRIDQASIDNLLRDPSTDQDIIDYAHFTGDIITDTVLAFAKKVRGMIPENRQIGMFFGYILELGQSRLVNAGHLEYERLYSSPDIDFFISPGTYSDRPMGGGSGFMVPNGTRLLNGKGFLHEIDHRTPTYNVNLDEYVSIAWMVPWKNQAETTAGLKREFSLAIINNTSLWCFDMWGGVFKTPETMKIVGQSKKLWDEHSSAKYTSLAEVALVTDPQSARYLNDSNPVVKKIYTETRNKLNRLGAPFEVFSFNDLEQMDLSRYKLLIFPGIFEITASRMDILKKHVLKDGRTILFCYAPGISNGSDIRESRVQELTGTLFKTNGVNKIEMDGWTSVYIHDYDILTPEVLKQLASESRVTLFCGDESPVFANDHLIAVHTATGGEKTITVPVQVKSVRELYTGKLIKVSKKKFIYNFQSPDTALFELIY
jgi:hypothetical protein